MTAARALVLSASRPTGAPLVEQVMLFGETIAAGSLPNRPQLDVFATQRD